MWSLFHSERERTRMQKNSSTKGSVMRGGSTTIRPAQGSFTTRKYDTTTATDTGGHNLGTASNTEYLIKCVIRGCQSYGTFYHRS